MNNLKRNKVLENIDNNVGFLFSDFLILGSGYNDLISVKANLFAKDTNWAIVFEKIVYNNRNLNIELELTYFGNCLKKQDSVDVVGNKRYFFLCTEEEINKIVNNENESEFELLNPQIGVDSIIVNNKKVKVEYDPNVLEKQGIKISNKMIDVVSYFRYLKEVSPDIYDIPISLIKMGFENEIDLLCTIDEWFHEDLVIPSKQKSYQNMADIIATKDCTVWNCQEANTNWRNWIEFGDF
ncbi:MAG: DUF7003 family protein [Putridiphycobacter sp.]